LRPLGQCCRPRLIRYEKGVSAGMPSAVCWGCLARQLGRDSL